MAEHQQLSLQQFRLPEWEDRSSWSLPIHIREDFPPPDLVLQIPATKRLSAVSHVSSTSLFIKTIRSLNHGTGRNSQNTVTRDRVIRLLMVRNGQCGFSN